MKEKLLWNQWNPFMFKKLTPIIKDGWIFADIGANKGEFTDFFKTFNYKRIYSFELNPVTADVLKRKYLNDPKIIIENYAVCDKDGEMNFYDGGVGAEDTCHNIIGHNMRFEKTKKLGTVKSTRMDSYFKNIKIDLMKIDVEGSELAVLEGLKNIIDNIGIILIECHLDQEWDRLRNILIHDLKLKCTNFYDDTEITDESLRPYQCLCKKLC